ncbi:unnamed protein product [Symbiodinium natans]|uniref:Phytanoyl-CoA dioxygenase n=1 Tax=Symbiodinium natans TaxID=878477 RepID=A0A812KMB8_9DINO|nr:unnamed protein product [Symbiodinium natans]
MMGPALDLGVNVIVFFTLLMIAICIFSVPSKQALKATRRSAQHKRLASDLGYSTQDGQSTQAQDSPLEKGQRCFGTVQRYSERNGIGFIACAECRAVYGRDVQLFQEDWEALELKVGAAVSFLLSVEERFPCPKGRKSWTWQVNGAAFGSLCNDFMEPSETLAAPSVTAVKIACLHMFASSAPPSPPDVVKHDVVEHGARFYVLGSARLGHLRDSSGLARRLTKHAEPRARHQLQARLHADGYLYLRSFLPSSTVCGARLSLLRQFQRSGLLADECPPGQARCGASTPSGRPEGFCSDEVLAVLNDPDLFSFLDGLFQDVVEVVFDANLRGIQPGQSTGFHTDSVYMGKLMVPDRPPILACWIALMPIPLELGGLVLCRGSNSHPGFGPLRGTYGKLDLDESDIGGTGWFTEDPEEVTRFGGCWETAEYGPGDVVIFTMHTVHGSSVNRTDSWRLSLDFRVQSSLAPPPVVSQNKGRWSRLRHSREFPRSMEEAKAAWNLEAKSCPPLVHTMCVLHQSPPHTEHHLMHDMAPWPAGGSCWLEAPRR